MAASSTQTIAVPEPKPVETTEPRPISAPADKPFTIKLQGQVPA